MKASVLRLVGHANRFTRNGVAALFAQVIAACIQGRIVPVVGAHNNIVAAGDPPRYRLGNSVGFLVNRRNGFFDRLELLFCAVQIVGNGCGGLFQAADFGADAIRLLADAGDILFQAVHRCGGGIILQLAVNRIVGGAGGGILYRLCYRFRHGLGDFGLDLVSGLGKQAFCAFLGQIVARAGIPGGRRVAVLQHGVKQLKLIGAVAIAVELDSFQNTVFAGGPCTIPQHPAVRLLNFELVSGFYVGNVILSVIARKRNAQPQRIGAGNEFVHNGQA